MNSLLEEFVDALRAVVEASGHEGAGPKRCSFSAYGCNCGRTEKLRVALADANRLLREWDA